MILQNFRNLKFENPLEIFLFLFHFTFEFNADRVSIIENSLFWRIKI